MRRGRETQEMKEKEEEKGREVNIVCFVCYYGTPVRETAIFAKVFTFSPVKTQFMNSLPKHHRHRHTFTTRASHKRMRTTQAKGIDCTVHMIDNNFIICCCCFFRTDNVDSSLTGCIELQYTLLHQLRPEVLVFLFFCLCLTRRALAPQPE